MGSGQTFLVKVLDDRGRYNYGVSFHDVNWAFSKTITPIYVLDSRRAREHISGPTEMRLSARANFDYVRGLDLDELGRQLASNVLGSLDYDVDTADLQVYIPYLHGPISTDFDRIQEFVWNIVLPRAGLRKSPRFWNTLESLLKY